MLHNFCTTLYITGSTESSNFPIASAIYENKSGGQDAFVTKFDVRGNMIYSTYLGGSGVDGGGKITVDADGSAYIIGTTNSSDFPTASAIYGGNGGGNDTFVAKILDDTVYPLVNAGEDITISGEDQDSTIIQGTASHPDNNPLTYRWLEGSIELSSWQNVGSNGEAYLDLSTISPFPADRHKLTLEVTDGQITASDKMLLTISCTETNLATNPSFEDGYNNWLLATNYLNRYYLDSQEKMFGSTALKVEALYDTQSGYGYGDGGVSQYWIEVEPNTTYTISCYAKTENPTLVSMLLGTNEYDANGAYVGQHFIYRGLSTDWGRVSFTFTTYPTTVKLWFGCWAHTIFSTRTEGEYYTSWIDGIKFENCWVASPFVDTSNIVPIADAGSDQSPHVTEVVTLNGAGSTDVDGDLLTYTWAFTAKPQDSTATLSDANAVSPTFTVDKAGTYVVSLIINDGTVDSQPDTVTISTLNSAPVAKAGPGQSPLVTETVTLDGSGSTDVDGDLLTYTWAFTAIPAGSNAALDDVNAVNPTFTVDKAGTYVVSLIINDGTVDSQPDTVTISTLNSAPVAKAGPGQSPLVTETVTLDGSGSTDVDGDLLTHMWAFTAIPAGSNAALDDVHAVNPTFTVDKAGTYVVSLIINDGTVDSQPDTVTISTLNSAPVAKAGPGQSPLVTETVTLDGSGSTDVDRDRLTYTWAFAAIPAGSNAALDDVHAVNPTLTVDKAGTYVISLIVNDGTVDCNQPDTVTISTLNSAPVAKAGTDQFVYVNNPVTLDGSGSTDVDGDPLTHTWAFTSKPAGSAAMLSEEDAKLVNPTFTADKAGTYVVSLIVNDGTVDSQPDTVVISTINTVPIADAGPDQSIILIGSTVQLDGSQSYDLEGDVITYLWAFTSIPAGSNATLRNPDTTTPTFVADVRGEYVIQLVVMDAILQSTPNTVLVSFENVKPVANAGTGQSVYVGDTVTLDGSGSTDANGDTLSYVWTLTTIPAGSSVTIANPALVTTSFVPDRVGTYSVVQKLCNN